MQSIIIQKSSPFGADMEDFESAQAAAKRMASDVAGDFDQFLKHDAMAG